MRHLCDSVLIISQLVHIHDTRSMSKAYRTHAPEGTALAGQRVNHSAKVPFISFGGDYIHIMLYDRLTGERNRRGRALVDGTAPQRNHRSRTTTIFDRHSPHLHALLEVYKRISKRFAEQLRCDSEIDFFKLWRSASEHSAEPPSATLMTETEHHD